MEKKGEKFRRIESPSSINTYKQCPRKYFYNYIKGLETLPSIHLTRGKVVHSALEDFFAFDISKISKQGFDYELKVILLELFRKHWKKSSSELNSFGLSKEQLKNYYDESVVMLTNFHNNFIAKISAMPCPPEEAFKKLSPETEKLFVSKDIGVRGFIDAIHDIEGKIILMDYKTSKKDIMTEEYRLQLAIYALLYYEKHKVMPHEVGINFLKFNEQTIKADNELLEFAKKEVALIHKLTLSDNMKDYPKTISPLCNWNGGKCDFYGVCVKE